MLKHARILIVESNAFVALDLQRTLHGMGYPAPIVVPGGIEAIQLIETTTFSLVLMELDLKGAVKGKEAAKIIQERCNTPVVFTTADAERSMLETTVACNPFACLLKPIRKCILRTAVENALLRQNEETNMEAVCMMRGDGRRAESGNAIPRTISPLVAAGHTFSRDNQQTPRSLEAMGYALEGYWEERGNTGSASYLEPHFQVDTHCSPKHPTNGRTSGRSRECRPSGQAIECTGLNEIRKSSDGSTYGVPRLRITLVSEES